MLAVLIEAAARSFALGLVVWLSLKVLRVQNPQVRMTTWTVVLAVSVAMPALTPWMKVTVPRSEPSLPRAKIAWIDIPPILLSTPAPGERLAPRGLQSNAAKAPEVRHSDWRFIAIGIYLSCGGTLLLRLIVGLALMRRVAGASRLVQEPWGARAHVRVSGHVAVPVTFASTILLPSGYTAWSERKLQAVLLHEGSHVAHGDFYVLLLASLHRAVFWFNPFAWWLLTHLTALAEMTSDDVAIEGLGDRRYYADILLDMAKTARYLPAGLAMARSSMVPWRIERILAAVPVHIAPRRRLLTAAMLMPLAALSAVTIVPRASPRLPSLAPPVADALAGLGLSQLDRYTGQFEISVIHVLTVTRHGEELFAQLTGEPKLRLIAVHAHEFADVFGDVSITFLLNSEGPAPEVILRGRNSGLRRGTRIDAAMADRIEAGFHGRMARAPDRFRDQTPILGGEAALRRTIEGLRSGNPGYEAMSPQLAGRLRKQLPNLQVNLRLFGGVDSISFKGVGPGGADIYGVKFANGSAEFRMSLAPGGALEDIAFRPDGDATQGGVEACALEPALKSSHDTVPIRLFLTNRSGTSIRLFWLNFGGRRVPQGTLQDNASMYVWTSISHPWIITGPSEECLEIVRPGQLTRFHVVEVPRAGQTARPHSVQRTAQVPGSDETLRLYIDGLRRGAPGYRQMTPEAAAATRTYLFRRQAILVKLGGLQAMTFQGVSPSGNDIYKIQFANGASEWQIGLLRDGRIANVELGPQL